MTMRKWANGSLVVLSVLFIGALCCVVAYPEAWWARMLLYTFEAGLVGALADLFAVTVLFRHPFGIKKFPHTAIIPRNRDKLVDSVVTMVEEQLLSKESLKAKVKQFHIVEALVGWVDRRPDGFVSKQGWAIIATLLSKIDLEGVSVMLDEQARKGLRQANVSPYAGTALKWVLAKGDFQSWIGGIIDFAAQRIAVEETKQVIRDMMMKEKDKFENTGGTVSKWFKRMAVIVAESTDSLNIDDAAEAMYRDMLAFIEQLRNPEHELRVLVSDMVHKLADDLQHSHELSGTVNNWKNDVLDKISLLPSIQSLLGSFKQMLTDEGELKYIVTEKRSVNHEDIKQWVGEFIQSYWDWFKSSQSSKDWLEGYVQQFIGKLIETQHALVGIIVRRTLEDYTEEKLVVFIESKVDTDLQRIRLNGALIGSLIGAGLFIFLHGIYGPILDWLA
jgi:uncharacterized membrane-anchored protein YjiN (DUF445 family)